MAHPSREFVIPIDKEDLLRGDDRFPVKLLDFDEAEGRLNAFKKSLKTNSCSAVLDHFDVVFSLLYDYQKIESNQLHKIYNDIIFPLLQSTYQYIESTCGLDSSGKQNAMNIVKMSFYLLSLFQKTYEEKESSKNVNLISKPKRGGRKVKSGDDHFDWLEQKREMLHLMYSFLSVPFGNVWGTNQPFDETFINLLGSFCYRTLESSDIGGVRNQNLRRSLAQVFTLLVIKFNHVHTFVPKAIQVMGCSEASALAVAEITIAISREMEERSKDSDVTSNRVPSVLISKVLNALLMAVEDDSTGSTSRSASFFLTELATGGGIELLSPCALIVVSFLNVDSYQVRNAALVSLSEMISHTNENDSEVSKIDQAFKENILSVLLAFLHDENAYVRSKVLQLWCGLVTSSVVPYEYFVPLLADAKCLLRDKSTYVAKNAVHLYSLALGYNPYAGRFNMTELNKELHKEEELLKELLCTNPLPPDEIWKEVEVILILAVSKVLSEDDIWDKMPEKEEDIDVDIRSVILIIAKLVKENLFDEAVTLLRKSEKMYPNAEEIRCNVSREDKTSYYVSALKKIFLNAAQANPQAIVPEYYENSVKVVSQNEKIKYLKGCCEFLDSIKEGSEIIADLLNGTGISECIEAIEFFTNCCKFSLGNSDKMVANMLRLMGSDKIEIKDAVAAAYKGLYLDTSKPTPRARATQVATRLISLVKRLDTSQRSSLEQLIHQWWQSGELTKDFVLVLLDRVTAAKDDLVPALFLLHMLAGVETSVVQGNFPLFKGLLSDKMDATTAEIVCQLLAMKSVDKIDGKNVRYSRDNALLVTCANILVDKFDQLSLRGYNNMATSILNAIFKLCFEPEELANDILYRMYGKAKISEGGEPISKINQTLLSRLMFVCADITFRKYQYCDKDVFNALRKCQNGVFNNAENEEDEGEMEADNAVAADDELHSEICLVYDKVFADDSSSLSAYIRNTVVQVVKGVKGLEFTEELKATAAISLAKFMMVSYAFAEKNISLMVTIMERCDIVSVRSNLVFAFGDLLCQHPNLVEPWTNYLYARLGDSSELIRRNTVVVLCHLMSSEMVKPRGGPLGELALRGEEGDPAISHRVLRLLNDLARRGNTLSNALPDLIATLSAPDRLGGPLSPNVFKSVVSKVLGLVRLERQTDLLADKLLSRVADCSSDDQADLIAHCLGLLLTGSCSTSGGCSVSTVRRLADFLPRLLPERLFRPAVSEAINSGITSALRSTKPNVKEIGLEVQEKLRELNKKHSQDEDMDNSISNKTISSGNDKGNTPISDGTNSDDVFQVRRSSRRTAETSVAEEVDSSVVAKKLKKSESKTKKTTKPNRRRKKVEDQSPGPFSFTEDEPSPVKIRRTRKIRHSSDSEDSASDIFD